MENLISSTYGTVGQDSTQVQRVSFVGYTEGGDGGPGLWNLQNLHAVPP